MSSVTAKALLHFEQTPLENQESDRLVADLESLTIGDLENAFSNGALPTQNDGLFEHIQLLDTDLRARLLDKNFMMPLFTAIKMQSCAPESYYGYQRSAQVHLIYNNCIGAANAYIEGQKKVVYGIELLRKSAKTSLHIFDQAISELLQEGRFDGAKTVADWIISLEPTLPMGYLHAAELYEIRGILKSAMEVYMQGMSSVSVDNRDLFAERIACLQQRIDQEIYCDIIVQMPLEITFEVAQYLTVRQRIECLGVSKGWEDRIKQCPGAWYMLDIEHDCKNVNITTIRKIKRLVRQVTMKSDSEEEPFVKDMLISMSNGEFENLTYLSLVYSIATTQQYIPHLVKIFECINLVRLDLVFNVSDTEESYIALHQVLRTCSHLKQLTYHSTSFPTRIDNELFPKVPPMITELSIGGYPHYEEAAGNPPYFVQLIPHFPYLVSLRIADSSPGELKTITEQCSNLRQLEVSDHHRDSSLDSSRLAAITPKGLEYLRVEDFTTPKDLADVIGYNTQTLISVTANIAYETDWDGQLLVDPDWEWEHIPKLNCPALKELILDIEYYWPYEQWIGDCPALEEISLVGGKNVTDSIFDALRRLPALRSLSLVCCEKLTDSGFSDFFHDIQNRGSQLHSVDITCCELLSTETLLSLIALQSLRNMSIHCIGVTGNALQDFAARVTINNTIESVNLHRLEDMEDQVLLKLVHALPQLKRLELWWLNSISVNGLYAIADLASTANLSELHVNNCMRIGVDVHCSNKYLLREWRNSKVHI